MPMKLVGDRHPWRLMGIVQLKEWDGTVETVEWMTDGRDVRLLYDSPRMMHTVKFAEFKRLRR